MILYTYIDRLFTAVATNAPLCFLNMSIPSIGQVCQELWNVDDNRLEPRRDYEINLQV